MTSSQRREKILDFAEARFLSVAFFRVFVKYFLGKFRGTVRGEHMLDDLNSPRLVIGKVQTNIVKYPQNEDG